MRGHFTVLQLLSSIAGMVLIVLEFCCRLLSFSMKVEFQLPELGIHYIRTREIFSTNNKTNHFSNKEIVSLKSYHLG